MIADRYSDRSDAGRELARLLWAFAPRSPVVVPLVLAGVPVAFEIARALDAPLEMSPSSVCGRTVIVVDDGGANAREGTRALRELRENGAELLVFATPVADPVELLALGSEADEVVCTRGIAELTTAAEWYEDFAPPPARDVEAMLASRGLGARQ